MLNQSLFPSVFSGSSSLTSALSSVAPGFASAPDSSGVLGALLGLALSVVQLVVGLAIAAFSINHGFTIVGRMLKGIDIWAEVKRKNTSIALLAAGVVISYTTVIAGGIGSMTRGLTGLVGGNFGSGLSALLGGTISLIVAILVSSFAITVTFKVMDRLTASIDERDEFRNDNVAIGIVYAGILIGVSGLIAAGVSGIGAGVTQFLDSVI